MSKSSSEKLPITRVLRDALEDDIVNGRIKPGDRLSEAALAERFDVSRTPVREALRLSCKASEQILLSILMLILYPRAIVAAKGGVCPSLAYKVSFKYDRSRSKSRY